MYIMLKNGSSRHSSTITTIGISMLWANQAAIKNLKTWDSERPIWMNITLTRWSLELERRPTRGRYTNSLPSRAGLGSALEMVNQGRFLPMSTSARPRLMIKLAVPVSNPTSRTPALHRPTLHSVSFRRLELIAKSRENAYLTSSMVHHRIMFRQRNPSI